MEAADTRHDLEERTVQEVVTAVHSKISATLPEAAPPLCPRPAVITGLFEQSAESIIRETLAAFRTTRLVNPAAGASTAVRTAEEEVRHVGANPHRGAAEEPRAAELLFEVGLPIVFQALSGGRDDPPSAVAVAQVLHRVIVRHLPPDTAADSLLEHLTVAYEEGRKFVSRELHDRVAHAIVAGIQRLELEQLRREADHPETEETIKIFRNVLADIQDLTVALRHSVGAGQLNAAIEDFVSNLDPSGLDATVAISGDQVALPPVVSEEAFAIVQEAIRNARRHASGATFVKMEIQWSTTEVLLCVSDDGEGFDAAEIRVGAVGLSSMRERAKNVRAIFEIATGNQGTTVTLRIPFTEPAPQTS